MSLKAIAAAVGVSVTTVSRALNGYDDVAEDTRKRIEHEAKKRLYRPNSVARRLKSGRANAVGLVFPVLPAPFNDNSFMEVVATLAHTLAKQEIDLLLIADDGRDNHRALIRMLRSRCVDALIVAHTQPQDDRLQHLQQSDYPFLALGRSELEKPYAWFDFDNLAGPALAIAHYAAQGFTRFGWLGSNEAYTFVRDRRQGFFAGLHAANLSPIAAFTHSTEPSRRAGYQLTRQWLTHPQPPQVILTDCNMLGDGAAIALREAGCLNGKGCVELMVYDGLPADSVIDEPVAAIMYATRAELGRHIADMVMGLLDNVPVEQLQILWQPRLTL